MSLDLTTKNGLNCKVPENEKEDDIPKFNLPDKNKEAENFYKENGFVVIKKIIKDDDCDIFLKYWNKEVKTFNGLMYRQASAKLEKNIFNNKKWIMNPILNIQSLNSKYFYNLRTNFDRILASNFLTADFIKNIIGEKPAIVQSMYFEGNSATWEHQDSYYLDDEDSGKMIAGWLALENIEADAGRFFVCPKSHLLDYASMDFRNIITKNHSEYIKSIVNLVREKNFKVKAPKLDKGDILLWNSLTIHGSLNSQNENKSRSSITFHVIKSSSRFQIFRSILRKLNYDENYHFNIFRPKDLNKKRNKINFYFESKFPSFFYFLKNRAIEYKVWRNNR